MSNDFVTTLPHCLAGLNLAGVLTLVPAYWAIRSGREEQHRLLMALALLIGMIFLVLYLVYHAIVGHVPFAGHGWVRPVYFSLLASHVLAALAVAYLVPKTVFRAWRGRWSAHVSIAPLTLSIWLFVCVSGLVVYAMAFYLYPS
ncbi:MAG: DUF420 domain-containing protein [Magnetococcales bacterium]|nr:DUF420 domain-containing protein [Magnetococcales bacterium]